jgi:hypothetical protein
MFALLAALLLIAPSFAVYEGCAFSTLDAPGHVIALPMRAAHGRREARA